MFTLIRIFVRLLKCSISYRWNILKPVEPRWIRLNWQGKLEDQIKKKKGHQIWFDTNWWNYNESISKRFGDIHPAPPSANCQRFKSATGSISIKCMAFGLVASMIFILSVVYVNWPSLVTCGRLLSSDRRLLPVSQEKTVLLCFGLGGWTVQVCVSAKNVWDVEGRNQRWQSRYWKCNVTKYRAEWRCGDEREYRMLAKWRRRKKK